MSIFSNTLLSFHCFHTQSHILSLTFLTFIRGRPLGYILQLCLPRMGQGGVYLCSRSALHESLLALVELTLRVITLLTIVIYISEEF